MAEISFFITFAAIVVYVVLGNYLYWAKILPVLDKPMELMPRGQRRDIDRYLEIIDERRESPWFKPILENERKFRIALLLGFALTFVFAVFE